MYCKRNAAPLSSIIIFLKAGRQDFSAYFSPTSLNLQDHGNILISKLVKAVYLLNRLKHVLSLKTKKMLYYAHFHSHMNYCSLFFPLLLKKLLNKIATLQRKAIRSLCNSSFRAHTDELFF